MLSAVGAGGSVMNDFRLTNSDSNRTPAKAMPTRKASQIYQVATLQYGTQAAATSRASLRLTVAYPRMPVLNGQLAGDDGGLVTCSVINDLQ